MDYPLNMRKTEPDIGFAVANNELEHRALSEHGYEPAYEPDQNDGENVPKRRGRPPAHRDE